MKILFIGHYKERGGWAQASKDYILAMHEAGLDVVCRNVTLTGDHPTPELDKLEKKSTEGVDVCIQHLLPHHMVGTKAFKRNIGVVDLESTSIKGLTWLEHLKLMDEVWVPNSDLHSSLTADGVENVKLVPHCSDIEKYTKKYPEVNIPQIKNKFKFYYIGDLNDRKNIRSIIRCFHSEFNYTDNVCMIFKVKKFGYSSTALQQELNKIIQEEKVKLRIHKDVRKHLQDVILTEDLDDNQICSIHQFGDCFICPSHGEAWSIPSFDAMAFGNTPICSNFGGPKNFIDINNKNTGYLINGAYSVCQCSDAAFPEIFTGKEYWFQPCEREIRKAMRHAYENKNIFKAKNDGLTRAKMFSREMIGKQIKEILR